MAVDKNQAYLNRVRKQMPKELVRNTKPTPKDVGLTDEERQMLEHLWAHHIAEHRHNEGR